MLRSLFFAGLCFFSVQSAEAQFIRFIINLPASFELTDRSSPPQILEPVAGGRMAGEMAGLRWMEIRAAENVDLIVEMKFNNPMNTNNIYFLNDGSTAFGSAQILTKGNSALIMNSGGKTIKDLPGNIKYLSAWLGMPAKQGGVLTITYP
jgi:hypothetical protein